LNLGWVSWSKTKTLTSVISLDNIHHLRASAGMVDLVSV